MSSWIDKDLLAQADSDEFGDEANSIINRVTSAGQQAAQTVSASVPDFHSMVKGLTSIWDDPTDQQQTPSVTPTPPPTSSQSGLSAPWDPPAAMPAASAPTSPVAMPTAPAPASQSSPYSISYGSGADPSSMSDEAWARSEAQRLGIDPQKAVDVGNTEGGFTEPGIQNRQGAPAYSPYQLYIGGPSNPGLGDEALAAGIDARDPRQSKAAITYALEHAAKNGWHAFQGAAAHGIGDWEGIGQAPANPASQTVQTQAQPLPKPAADLTEPAQAALDDPDKWALCGPVAAVIAALNHGKDWTVDQAKKIAVANGLWDPDNGMHGLGSTVNLLSQMGIDATTGDASEQHLAADAQNGNTPIISTNKHYFILKGYNPQTRQFDTSTTGTVYRGGSRWMTLDEIDHLGGGIQGAAYIDNPSSPHPSSVATATSPPAAMPQGQPSSPGNTPANQPAVSTQQQQTTQGQDARDRLTAPWSSTPVDERSGRFAPERSIITTPVSDASAPWGALPSSTTPPDPSFPDPEASRNETVPGLHTPQDVSPDRQSGYGVWKGMIDTRNDVVPSNQPADTYHDPATEMLRQPLSATAGPDTFPTDQQPPASQVQPDENPPPGYADTRGSDYQITPGQPIRPPQEPTSGQQIINSITNTIRGAGEAGRRIADAIDQATNTRGGPMSAPDPETGELRPIPGQVDAGTFDPRQIQGALFALPHDLYQRALDEMGINEDVGRNVSGTDPLAGPRRVAQLVTGRDPFPSAKKLNPENRPAMTVLGTAIVAPFMPGSEALGMAAPPEMTLGFLGAGGIIRQLPGAGRFLLGRLTSFIEGRQPLEGFQVVENGAVRPATRADLRAAYDGNRNVTPGLVPANGVTAAAEAEARNAHSVIQGLVDSGQISQDDGQRLAAAAARSYLDTASQDLVSASRDASLPEDQRGAALQQSVMARRARAAWDSRLQDLGAPSLHAPSPDATGADTSGSTYVGDQGGGTQDAQLRGAPRGWQRATVGGGEDVPPGAGQQGLAVPDNGEPARPTFQEIKRPGDSGWAVMRTEPSGQASLVSTHLTRSEARDRAAFETTQSAYKPVDRGAHGGNLPPAEMAPEDLLGGYAQQQAAADAAKPGPGLFDEPAQHDITQDPSYPDLRKTLLALESNAPNQRSVSVESPVYKSLDGLKAVAEHLGRTVDVVPNPTQPDKYATINVERKAPPELAPSLPNTEAAQAATPSNGRPLAADQEADLRERVKNVEKISGRMDLARSKITGGEYQHVSRAQAATRSARSGNDARLLDSYKEGLKNTVRGLIQDGHDVPDRYVAPVREILDYDENGKYAPLAPATTAHEAPSTSPKAPSITGGQRIAEPFALGKEGRQYTVTQHGVLQAVDNGGLKGLPVARYQDGEWRRVHDNQPLSETPIGSDLPRIEQARQEVMSGGGAVAKPAASVSVPTGRLISQIDAEARARHDAETAHLSDKELARRQWQGYDDKELAQALKAAQSTLDAGYVRGAERRGVKAKVEAIRTEQVARKGEQPAPPPVVDQSTRTAKMLRDAADRLEPQIQGKLNPASSHQTMTDRRARIAGGMADQGRALQQTQHVMRQIADAHEAGTLPEALKGVRSRADVEALLRARSDTMPQPAVNRHAARDLLEKTKGKRGLAEPRRTIERALSRVPDSEHMAPLLDSEVAAHETLWKAAEMPSFMHDGTADYRRAKKMGIAEPGRYKQAVQAIKEYTREETPAERQAKRVSELERQQIGNKDGDFFPTPKNVAERMVHKADIKPGMSVLEPSAGTGHLAEAVREHAPEAKLTAIERSSSRREILQAKGFNVAGESDFLQHQGKYDRIVMNPPFSKNQDIAHVRHAYDLLKLGGKVSAIMSEHAFFSDDKPSRDFRDWLAEQGGSSEKLPAGTFNQAGLTNTTGVAARLVTVEKPTTATSVPVAAPESSNPWEPDAYDRAENARMDAEIARRPPHGGYLAEDEGIDQGSVWHSDGGAWHVEAGPQGMSVPGAFETRDVAQAALNRWHREQAAKAAPSSTEVEPRGRYDPVPPEEAPASVIVGNGYAARLGDVVRASKDLQGPITGFVRAGARDWSGSQANWRLRIGGDEYKGNHAPDTLQLVDPASGQPFPALPVGQWGRDLTSVAPTPRTLAGPTGSKTFALGIYDRTKKYPMRWRAVPLDDLVTSHSHTSLAPNPDFPQELQPRARETAATRQWLETESTPERFSPTSLLTDTHELGGSAPIIGPDGLVESGNGRTMLLKHVRDTRPDVFAGYQRDMPAAAEKVGIKRSELAGIKDPVLVRENLTPFGEGQRAEFTKEANTDDKLELSAGEKARADARLVDAEDLAALAIPADGDIRKAVTSAENAEWVRKIVGRMPPGERGGMITGKSGRLSDKGAQRIRNAIFARVFGGEAGLQIQANYMDAATPEEKAIGHAISGALVDLAKLEGSVADGQTDKGLAIAEPLAEAVLLRTEAKATKQKLSELVASRQALPGMGDPADEITQALALWIDKNVKRPALLRETLQEYARTALREPPPGQTSMFGEAGPRSAVEVWDEALRAVEENRGLAPTWRGSAPAEQRPAPEAPSRPEQAAAPRAQKPPAASAAKPAAAPERTPPAAGADVRPAEDRGASAVEASALPDRAGDVEPASPQGSAGRSEVQPVTGPAAGPVAPPAAPDLTPEEIRRNHMRVRDRVRTQELQAGRNPEDHPEYRKRSDRIAELDAQIAQQDAERQSARQEAARQESERTGVLRITRDERRELLRNVQDRYVETNQPKVEKGIDSRGELIHGYEHNPDVFLTSDLSGQPVRNYVVLPDGRIAHPDEITNALERGRIVIDDNAPIAAPAENTAAQPSAPSAPSADTGRDLMVPEAAPPASPPPVEPPSPPSEPPGAGGIEPPSNQGPRDVHTVGAGYWSTTLPDEAVGRFQKMLDEWAQYSRSGGVKQGEVFEMARALGVDDGWLSNVIKRALGTDTKMPAVESEALKTATLRAFADVENLQSQLTDLQDERARRGDDATLAEQTAALQQSLKAAQSTLELVGKAERRDVEGHARALAQQQFRIAAGAGAEIVSRLTANVDALAKMAEMLKTMSGKTKLTEEDLGVLRQLERLLDESGVLLAGRDDQVSRILDAIKRALGEQGQQPKPPTRTQRRVITGKSEDLAAEVKRQRQRLGESEKKASPADKKEAKERVDLARQIVDVDRQLRRTPASQQPPLIAQRAALARRLEDLLVKQVQDAAEGEGKSLSAQEVDEQIRNRAASRMSSQMLNQIIGPKPGDPNEIAATAERIKDEIIDALRQENVLEQTPKSLGELSQELVRLNREQAKFRDQDSAEAAAALEPQRQDLLGRMNDLLRAQVLRQMEKTRAGATMLDVDKALARGELAKIRRAIEEQQRFPDAAMERLYDKMERERKRALERDDVNAVLDRIRQIHDTGRRTFRAADIKQDLIDMQPHLEALGAAGRARADALREGLFKATLMRGNKDEERFKNLTAAQKLVDPSNPQQVGGFLKALREPGWLDHAQEAMVVNMLTSPLTWSLVGQNFTSNALQIGVRNLSVLGAHGYGEWKYLNAGMGAAAPEAYARALEIMRQGYLTDDVERAMMTGDWAQTRPELMGSVPYMGRAYRGGTIAKVGVGDRALNVTIPGLYHISTRPLNAMDVMQGHMLYAGTVAQLAYRKAGEMLAASKGGVRVPSGFGPEEVVYRATPDGTSGYIAKATKTLITDRDELTHHILRNLHKPEYSGIKDEAGAIEDYYLLRKPLNRKGDNSAEGMVDRAFQRFVALRHAERSAPLGVKTLAMGAHLMLPFFNTSYNATKQMLSLSPPGIGYNVYRAATAPTKQDRAEAVLKAALGVGLMALSYYLQSQDLLTGDGPDDAGDNARWRRTHEPHSLFVAGKWRRLDGTVIGMPLIATANALEDAKAALAKTGRKPEEAMGDAALAFGGGLIKGTAAAIFGQSSLRAASDMGNLFQGRTTAAAMGANYASRIMPATSMLRWLANMGDPVMRDPKSFTDFINVALPGGRSQVQTKLNEWGEAIPNPRYGLAASLDPFRSVRPWGLDDPIIKKLDESSVTVPTAPGTVRNVPLTDDERRAFTLEAGPIIKQQLGAFVLSPGFEAMPISERQKAVNFIIDPIRKSVGDEILTKMGNEEIARRLAEQTRTPLPNPERKAS